MTYIYILKAIYMHICPVCMHIWQYIPLCTAHAVYIDIYMQCETLYNCAQTTDAAGSSSQNSIAIQQSPPESSAGFYQETSR